MNRPGLLRWFGLLALLAGLAGAIALQASLPPYERLWPLAQPALGGFAALGAGASALVLLGAWCLRWISRGPKPKADGAP